MERVTPNPFEFFAGVRDVAASTVEFGLGPRWPGLRHVAQYVEHAVHLLDSAVPIPGTRMRIGLDPLIGLVPVIGDVVGGALSLGLLFLAVQYRVPSRIIGVMVINVAVDTAVGGIPIVGDLFDFVWQANTRNYALIMKHRGDVTAPRPARYWLKVGGLTLAGVAAVAAPGALFLWLVRS